MTYSRLPAVQEACELDPSALDIALSDQVEHIGDLLKTAEGEAEAFFGKTHVTLGMSRLLSEGLKRLSGKTTQAVFELRQAMGGGKTHSMLALGLLARNPQLRPMVPARVVEGSDPVTATVVAINGRSISKDRFLWGDVAAQLNRGDDFGKFWRQGADAPREDDWMALIGDEPTLILLDELPPYFDYAVTRPVGGGTLAQVTTYALSNLLSAAMKLPRTAIVVSNLTGSYAAVTREIANAVKNVADETKRAARSITPVDLNTNEIYEILRKRLFKRLPDADTVAKIAEAYGEEINLAVRSKSIARSPEQIADEVAGSYPFHPSVKNIIALFKENENFRQTRGLMQFVSKMLKSVWQGEQRGEVYLIGCNNLDLTIADVREELNRIGELEGAMTTDVMSVEGSAHAQVIDAARNTDAATQVARLLLTASLSQNVESVKGLSRAALIEYLIAPGRSATEFGDAFDELQKECWYLHRKENDVWYFSNVENLRKRIQNRAENAPDGKIEEELRRRLRNAFEPTSKVAYQVVHALPRIEDVHIESVGRHCLVMNPDSKTPPEKAQEFLVSQVFKNGFCVVTGDGSFMGNLDDKTRMIWAVAKVKAELASSPAHKAELDELEEAAEFDFSAALTTLFNRVYYPMPTADQSGSRLVPAPLKLLVERKQTREGSVLEANGEVAIEATLRGTGAKKLVDMASADERDGLVKRAETVLWPDTQTRIPWKDVVSRAQSNVRWPWLPSKGLETVRDHAVATGRWSFDVDGYVDKAPPKPRTTANAVTRAYDDLTGEAEVEVIPQNAGKKPEILISESGRFDEDGRSLERNPFSTRATRLWFLVKDPEGKHEQGEAVVWNNKLTLTHQPQFLPGKRVVTLTVVPSGEIRWNLDGSNVKDGKVYDGPITIDGLKEARIFAYAVHGGVSVERDFVIAGSEDEQAIDTSRAATLKKRIAAAGAADVFKTIKAAEDNKARLLRTNVTIGDGSNALSIRAGDQVNLDPIYLREMIGLCRKAIGDEQATVNVSFSQIAFPSGFDLERFAEALGEDVRVSDVEQ